MDGTRSALLEMGFSQWKIEKALSATGNSGLEQAMEWLIAHEGDIPAEASSIPAGTEEVITSEAAEDTVPLAKSLKCDDCGKILRTTEEAEFHAVKTKHSNFSESTDEKKPLTNEEKKEQLKLLEEKMRKKRIEREEQEKKESVEREKKRIQAGKNMVAIKKKMDDDEMRKLADQRRREKEDEKRARERVKQQIEADKLARRQKAEGNDETAAPSVAPAVTPLVPKEVKDYTQTTIQVRLIDGSTLRQTFGVKEPLSAVRLFIDLNRKDGLLPYKLMTTFPRKVFTEEEYQSPLEGLGLVPAAVLVAAKIS